MTVRFDYKYEMEYILKTWSSLNITGSGNWCVNVSELAEEFCESNEDFDVFLEDYFYRELNIDGKIEFNEEDIKILSEYCIKYKNENSNNESNFVD